MNLQKSPEKSKRDLPRRAVKAVVGAVKDFNSSPEKPVHKLPRKAVALGVGGLMLLGGVAHLEDNISNHKKADHISNEINQFSYKDLINHYMELGINPEDVTIQPVGDFETTAQQIAEDLYAKDPETVAQEINVQLDGNIKPGEMIVIPNDQLSPPRRLV